jgi:mono/diheme cytochrome c family protein
VTRVTKGLLLGFLAAVVLLVGAFAFYIGSGMAPAAVADPPMPFEKTIAGIALTAHINKQETKESPVPADEPNLRGGAHVYKEQCALCHGLPGQASPVIAAAMYPPAPQLFKGKGVTDDPASESHWKAANGIRLTGMPSFKATLTDLELWQVSQLVAHADTIPDSVKRLLVP